MIKLFTVNLIPLWRVFQRPPNDLVTLAKIIVYRFFDCLRVTCAQRSQRFFVFVRQVRGSEPTQNDAQRWPNT